MIGTPGKYPSPLYVCLSMCEYLYVYHIYLAESYIISSLQISIQHNYNRKQLNLSLSILPYPPYLSDVAPHNFHCFFFLQITLNDKDVLKKIRLKRL